MNKITSQQIENIFSLPLDKLIFKAQRVHKKNFEKGDVQLASLISIKTGSCPEDCKYCPQSARYDTGLEKEKLMQIEQVLEAAKAAKASGSSRFCMGAAWRSPHDRDIPAIEAMIREVKGLGLETCMTLGMLSESQADKLSEAGLDYYNHNLDTSEEFYGDIITTRIYEVLKTGVKVAIDNEKKLIVTIRKADLAKDIADARPEVFSPNNALDAKITELDLKTRKVKLSVKAAQIDEEKSLIAKFGEGATKSGATLKGIFEKAIGKKKNKNEK